MASGQRKQTENTQSVPPTPKVASTEDIAQLLKRVQEFAQVASTAQCLKEDGVLEGLARFFPSPEERNAENLHRRKMELRGQTLSFIDTQIGRVCALLVAVGVLAVIYVSMPREVPWYAALFGPPTMTVIILGFMKQRPANKSFLESCLDLGDRWRRVFRPGSPN